MRLRLFQSDVGTQFPEASHERFADLLIHGEDAFLRCDHCDAISNFIGMEDRSTSCGPADDINPFPGAFFEVDLCDVLVPAKRNSRRRPAVNAYDIRMSGRQERLSKLLVVLHVFCAGPISRITELPDHLVMDVARNDTALAPRDE